MKLLSGPARLILKLLGWTLLDLPQRPSRAVAIGYPHTSNWDFVWGLLALAALRLDAHWVGKDSLFRHGCGPLFRALGGIPVNRRQPAGFVDKMAAEFTQREHFLLLMAPEGTRSLTPGWKSGFYRIARAANVPVVVGAIDYPGRTIGLVDCIELTGDAEADMARIAVCYHGRRGRHPEKASPLRLL